MTNPVPRLTGPWQCGFCGVGNHDRCSRGWRPPSKARPILVCACPICAPKGVICLRCGNTNVAELDGRKWECHDIDACVSSIAARSNENPLRVKLRLVHQDALKAKQVAQRDRILAAILADPDNPNAGKCECGCGDPTKGGRFRPGHDAKLRSKLQKAENYEELERRGWL